MENRIVNLEETLTHLSRIVDELSTVVAHQEGEIAQLKSRQQMLMEREARREADEGGSVAIVDSKPPHW